MSAARNGASAVARGRMAARGSERIVDAIEELVLELPARVRGSRAKLSEQALGVVHALVDDLNLVSRDEVDELELRVAQLEHRLRLIEQQRDASSA
jgi:polyhydroxyalkanoate synthesis regulator phasin